MGGPYFTFNIRHPHLVWDKSFSNTENFTQLIIPKSAFSDWGAEEGVRKLRIIHHLLISDILLIFPGEVQSLFYYFLLYGSIRYNMFLLLRTFLIFMEA